MRLDMAYHSNMVTPKAAPKIKGQQKKQKPKRKAKG